MTKEYFVTVKAERPNSSDNTETYRHDDLYRPISDIIEADNGTEALLKMRQAVKKAIKDLIGDDVELDNIKLLKIKVL